MATASADGTIRVWQCKNERGEDHLNCRVVLEGHSSEVTSVKFCSERSALFSVSTDMTASLWDVNRTEPVQKWSVAHPLSCPQLVSTDDESYSKTDFSSFKGGFLRVPNLQSRLSINSAVKSSLYAGAVNEKNTLLSVGGISGQVLLWDWRTYNETTALAASRIGDDIVIKCLEFLSDGTTVC